IKSSLRNGQRLILGAELARAVPRIPIPPFLVDSASLTTLPMWPIVDLLVAESAPRMVFRI
ncbi:MAG: hypothetical protein ACRD36_10070, partial [Candidatus Acidiferrum sp.]